MLEMIRGTSRTFRFKIPYDVNRVTSAEIIFWQDDYAGTDDRPLPIKKNLEAITKSPANDEFYITLEQSETYAFTDRKKAYVQMKCCMGDGFVFGTKAMPITVYPTKIETILK